MWWDDHTSLLRRTQRRCMKTYATCSLKPIGPINDHVVSSDLLEGSIPQSFLNSYIVDSTPIHSWGMIRSYLTSKLSIANLVIVVLWPKLFFLPNLTWKNFTVGDFLRESPNLIRHILRSRGRYAPSTIYWLIDLIDLSFKLRQSAKAVLPCQSERSYNTHNTIQKYTYRVINLLPDDPFPGHL